MAAKPVITAESKGLLAGNRLTIDQAIARAVRLGNKAHVIGWDAKVEQADRDRAAKARQNGAAPSGKADYEAKTTKRRGKRAAERVPTKGDFQDAMREARESQAVELISE